MRETQCWHAVALPQKFNERTGLDSSLPHSQLLMMAAVVAAVVAIVAS